MRIFRMWFLLLTMTGVGVAGAQTPAGDPGSPGGRRALLAAYVASIDDGAAAGTGLSISNILGAPIGEGFPVGEVETGPITFYLFNTLGTVYVFNTADHPDVGFGVDLNGNLQPGLTYTVHLAEIFQALFPDRVPEDRDFAGYAWIVADFDAVTGTYFNFFPLEGSSQSFTMEPLLGGLPVSIQPQQ